MIIKIYNDCETTGTDPVRNGLIQFSFKIKKGQEWIESHDLKIQPLPGDVIEDQALEANHITREELLSSERMTPREAYKFIIATAGKYVDKFDSKDKMFWVGFNARFDMDFTREFFKKNGDVYFGSWFWFPPLDVMGLAGYLLQNSRASMKDFKLRTVWEYLYPERLEEFTDEQWHDGLFDIERTIDIEDALRRIVMAQRKA